MKTTITFLLISFLFLFSPRLQAQECSSGITMINELWQNFDPMDLVNDSDGVKKQTDKLKNELKSIVSINLKKDAPRILPVGNGEKKINLRQHKKRIFVTTPLKQDEVTFTITRPENDSEATVTICSHTLKGATENVEQLRLSTEHDGTIEIPISNCSGKIISVTITNTGSQKLAYMIMAR